MENARKDPLVKRESVSMRSRSAFQIARQKSVDPMAAETSAEPVLARRVVLKAESAPVPAPPIAKVPSVEMMAAGGPVGPAPRV